MDVNGVKFHLLFGEADWRPLIEGEDALDLRWETGSQSVILRPELFRFPARASEATLKPEDRRGIDCDRFGTAYWINAEQDGIRYRPCRASQAADFWSVDDLFSVCEEPCPESDFTAVKPAPPVLRPRLRGLAVTGDHYLVAGTLNPGGLLIFDLHGGGPPIWQRWPEGLMFEPFDLAAASDGGVWVLDRGSDIIPGRYWKLDRYFCVVPTSGLFLEISAAVRDDFKPVGGKRRKTPAVRFPEGVEIGMASPIDVAMPAAILGLDSDSVLILETEPGAEASAVHLYRNGMPRTSIALDDDLIGDLLPGETIRAHDFVFAPAKQAVPGKITGSLYVVAEDGNQAFLFSLVVDLHGLHLRLEPEYLPLRRFTGKGLLLCGGRPRYDLGEQIQLLVAQPRRRFAGEGRVENIVLDGKLPGTVWHRLLLDACIPNGSALKIDARSSDDRGLLAEAPWDRNLPAPYPRAEGSELPFHQPFGATGSDHEGVGTWEILFQSSKGRYIELRLRLFGNGRSSPRIRALRAYYPRFSYLREYLPAVYREEPVSASFLDRYLSNVEGLFTSLEGRIERSEILFDTRTSPSEYLDWLAGWLGTALDPDWEDSRRRLFLAHAELLFRWRGTLAGLRAMIRLAIDPCPDESIFDELGGTAATCRGQFFGGDVRILEHFLQRSYSSVALGDPSGGLLPGFIAEGAPWEPAHGAEALHRQFRDFVVARHGAGDAVAALAALQQAWGVSYATVQAIRLSPVVPAHPGRAQDWRDFTTNSLTFEYFPVTSARVGEYRDFLQRRYRRIDALNTAYLLAGAQQHSGFGAVPIPGESDFPETDARLFDWIQFVSLFLPIRESAHRFSVLVPSEVGESADAVSMRVAKVQSVVNREKPAHTNFDIKPFWAAFQVGAARLGLDTALGQGSRFTALVLGQGHLGANYLAASHPWNVKSRTVVGRDALPEN